MTDFLIGNGTPIILANSGDYNPTAGTSLTGTRTHQLNLTSLAANAWRQSAKVDFGATRGRFWFPRIAFEPVSAPGASGVVELYIGFSDSATAANNNPANLSGSDAAWNGYGAASTDADEAIGQLLRVGSAGVTADADVHIADLPVFSPWLRYGCIVVRNSLSVALDSDAIQMSIQLWPVVDQF